MFRPHCNLNENFFNEIVQVFQLPPPLLLVTFVISSKRWRESERGGQSREREGEKGRREGEGEGETERDRGTERGGGGQSFGESPRDRETERGGQRD